MTRSSTTWDDSSRRSGNNSRVTPKGLPIWNSSGRIVGIPYKWICHGRHDANLRFRGITDKWRRTHASAGLVNIWRLPRNKNPKLLKNRRSEKTDINTQSTASIVRSDPVEIASAQAFEEECCLPLARTPRLASPVRLVVPGWGPVQDKHNEYVSPFLLR
jgi:hypothetical protein